MSKVRFNPIVESFQRAMGNLVYLDYEGEPFVRRRVIPSNPNTEAQRSVRDAFAKLGADWRQLGGVVKASWIASARSSRKKRMRGLAAFIGANARRQRVGEPLELCREFGEEALSSFSAAPGSAAGSIDCSFTKSLSGEGKHLTLFVQKKENGHAGGDLTRIPLGAAQKSPYTITNLEGGASYYVYAILTDKTYEEAGAVSASSSALSLAK